jgi:hypothetical protein
MVGLKTVPLSEPASAELEVLDLLAPSQLACGDPLAGLIARDNESGERITR